MDLAPFAAIYYCRTSRFQSVALIVTISRLIGLSADLFLEFEKVGKTEGGAAVKQTADLMEVYSYHDYVLVA